MKYATINKIYSDEDIIELFRLDLLPTVYPNHYYSMKTKINRSERSTYKYATKRWNLALELDYYQLARTLNNAFDRDAEVILKGFMMFRAGSNHRPVYNMKFIVYKIIKL